MKKIRREGEWKNKRLNENEEVEIHNPQQTAQNQDENSTEGHYQEDFYLSYIIILCKNNATVRLSVKYI